MTAWYEFEEIAGRWWHGWAAGAVSYPRHDDAAAGFDALRDVLAIYFRALGGGAGIELTTARSAEQDHRLSWRQRLGLTREPMELARFDGEHVILPAVQALYPRQEDNRRLYFWQTAFLAHSRLVATTSDPLQRDLLEIAEATATTRALLDELPGWRAPYARLSAELLALRPARRLPEHEQAVEQLICHLLDDARPLDPLAASMHRAGAMLISGVWSDLKKRRILLVDHQNDHNQQKRIRHDRFYP